jgi:N6-adenosine-specific RNA methylase IME4
MGMSLNGRLKEQFAQIPLALVDPSPYQRRRYFDEESLRQLGRSIKEDGLLQAVVCRRKGERYELIAGERRVRGARLEGIETLPARIVEFSDRQARKMCLLENVHRSDLAPVEEVPAIAEWVDACLLEVEGYEEFGADPSTRVKALLGKMETDRREETDKVPHKFMGAVKAAFAALNRPVNWRSFYNNDLPLIVSLDADVAEVCIKERLNKSQSKAMQKLKDGDRRKFEEVQETGQLDLGFKGKVEIQEVSAMQIDEVARQGALSLAPLLAAEAAGPLPTGRYSVAYADPAWFYNDQRTGGVRSGAAAAHYPPLPTEDICNLKDSKGRPVHDVMMPDAALFLWATAPCLRDAVQVINAWGFEYKAQFVWNKVRGYNGHYNDVCHEHLLIAIRGSFPPRCDHLRSSIVTVEKTKHSRKPDVFYEIIEELYPLADHPTHVEIFARSKRPGWAFWGNEV